MEIVTTCVLARKWVRDAQQSGQRIGFVPTMGALHDGHLSLIDHALKTCDGVVVSIFVNPTQFAPTEDLDQYPRPLESDLAKLRDRGVLMVFTPKNEEMYPGGASTVVRPPAIAEHLEGEHRPGHFEGVATIVAKLFGVVPADLGVFGQKDFQQFKVIEAMVRDLDFGVKVEAAPIIRDPDGLAMSSRNTYLSGGERTRALAISRSLDQVQAAVEKGELNVRVLEKLMIGVLSGSSGVDSVDYAVVVDSESLMPIEKVGDHTVALIAAHVGGTRLIDNRLLKLP